MNSHYLKTLTILEYIKELIHDAINSGVPMPMGDTYWDAAAYLLDQEIEHIRKERGLIK